MRTRVILLVLLGLVFAGAATLMVLKRTATPPAAPAQTAESAPQTAVPQGPPTVEILVAVRDLPSGEVIGPTDVRAVPWPRSGLPEGGMAPDSIAFGETVVRLPIARNTPVLENQIIQKGTGGHLSYMLGEGMVASTIAVTEVAGVAGHVAPGDFVDILFTQSLGGDMASALGGGFGFGGGGGGGGGADNGATETLLMRIKIIATDQRVDDINTEARLSRTVTLEVSPKEAEILALAQQLGQLTLSLNSASQPEIFDPAVALQVRRGPLGSFTMDDDISPLLAEARDAARRAVEAEEASEREAAAKEAELLRQAAAEAAGTEIQPASDEPAPHVVIIVRGAAAQEVAIVAAPGAEEPGAGEDTKAKETIDADAAGEAKSGGKTSPIERNVGGETRQ